MQRSVTSTKAASTPPHVLVTSVRQEAGANGTAPIIPGIHGCDEIPNGQNTCHLRPVFHAVTWPILVSCRPGRNLPPTATHHNGTDKGKKPGEQQAQERMVAPQRARHLSADLSGTGPGTGRTDRSHSA